MKALRPFLPGLFGVLLLITGSCEKETFRGTVTDYDGNVYQTIKIGDQWWMAENLMTTKFTNGELINSGVYIQNNNANNVGIYGRLYTWTVAVDNRKLCPTGWHLPSESEYNVLLSNVTSPADLKEEGYSHWLPPNTLATNSVSFTALPGGYYTSTEFTGINETGLFWLSDEVDAARAKGFRLYYDNSPTTGDLIHSQKNNAFSVRCIKD